MRLLPVAGLVAICGVVPPKHQQNEKTMIAHISQTKQKVCKNLSFLGNFAKKISLFALAVSGCPARVRRQRRRQRLARREPALAEEVEC